MGMDIGIWKFIGDEDEYSKVYLCKFRDRDRWIISEWELLWWVFDFHFKEKEDT